MWISTVNQCMQCIVKRKEEVKKDYSIRRKMSKLVNYNENNDMVIVTQNYR